VEASYWRKQTVARPLFPDLLWSKPETRALAGKLLIVGGNAQGFAAAAEAYNQALHNGVGIARVLLPDSLQKAVGSVFEAGEFAPSTPIGSFAQAALASVVDLALWSDGVLVAGDVGRNSETAILLEQFLDHYEGQVTITKDAADLICQQPLSVLQRPNSVLVLSSGQLQKLGVNAHFARPFSSSAALTQLLEHLYEFTKRFECSIITKHNNQYIVATREAISTTPAITERKIWRLTTASAAAVGWLQQPTKQFAALTTALLAVAGPLTESV
jgi:NAD(P)H-hydrate repair Nnr-like enzyme with NAD(P)H-hydrate dehydratase domain